MPTRRAKHHYAKHRWYPNCKTPLERRQGGGRLTFSSQMAAILWEWVSEMTWCISCCTEGTLSKTVPNASLWQKTQLSGNGPEKFWGAGLKTKVEWMGKTLALLLIVLCHRKFQKPWVLDRKLDGMLLKQKNVVAIPKIWSLRKD